MRLIEYQYRHQGVVNWLAVIGWFGLAKMLRIPDVVFYLVLAGLALALNYGVRFAAAEKG